MFLICQKTVLKAVFVFIFKRIGLLDYYVIVGNIYTIVELVAEMLMSFVI